MGIILAIALVFSGGVSLAANNAIPGDFLYPVKVSINEEVRGTLSLSTEAKAKWEARLAERRLEESAELEVKGKLNAETQANLEERFQAHMERIRELIIKLEEKGNFEAAAAITTGIEASIRNRLNAAASANANAEGNTGGTMANELRNVATAALNTLATIKADLEVKMSEDERANANTNANTNVNVNSGNNDSNTDVEAEGSGSLNIG